MKIELDAWPSKENNRASKGQLGHEVKGVGRRRGNGEIKGLIC